MDFELPEELRMLKETLRRFIDNEVIPIERDAYDGPEMVPAIREKLEDRAKELGIWGVDVPESLGGLGMGGGSMGGLMTARGSANLLTRVTAGLAVCFFATSILLAIMAGGTKTTRSIVDQPASTAPVQPDQPQLPRVPLN